MSEGRTIFSAATTAIRSHFCDNLGYVAAAGKIDAAAFLLDIATGTLAPIRLQAFFCDRLLLLLAALTTAGVERPKYARSSLATDALEKYFLDSTFGQKMLTAIEACSSHSGRYSDLLADDEGHLRDESGLLRQFARSFYRYRVHVLPPSLASLLVSLERAFLVKVREREVLVKCCTSAVVPALMLGYMGFGSGDYGDYCLDLSGLPSANSMNVSSVLFFMTALLFTVQILNIHVNFKKMEVLRYEITRGFNSIWSFWIATLLSEITFSILFFLVFSNLVYFMFDLAHGVNMYLFFLKLCLLSTILAVSVALFISASFKSEYLVRDVFLLWFFIMVLFCGYPISYPYLNWWVRKASILNPLKWIFEATFVWKFETYIDGETYMETYDFHNFDKANVFPILRNYILITLALYWLSLFPPLSFIRRSKSVYAVEQGRDSGSTIEFSSLKDKLNTNAPSSNNHDFSYTTSSSVFQTNGRSLSTGLDRQQPILPVVLHRVPSVSVDRSLSGRAITATNDSEKNHRRMVFVQGPTVTLKSVYVAVKVKTGIRKMLSNSSAYAAAVWRGNSGGSTKPQASYVNIAHRGTVAETSSGPMSEFAPPPTQLKFEYILRNITGQVEAGKLSLIMG